MLCNILVTWAAMGSLGAPMVVSYIESAATNVYRFSHRVERSLPPDGAVRIASRPGETIHITRGDDECTVEATFSGSIWVYDVGSRGIWCAYEPLAYASVIHHPNATDRRSNVAQLLRHPSVRLFEASWGADEECRRFLAAHGITISPAYWHGEGHILGGKIGHWCSFLRFLRDCDRNARTCISIEDDVVLSRVELDAILRHPVASKPMLRLGPKGCTDCVVLYDPKRCDELFRQAHTITNPVDVFFSPNYSRGTYHGTMLDPSNHPRTSIIRSLPRLNIEAFNREQSALHPVLPQRVAGNAAA
jgi:hypothetical protein